jgi:hypothetical protein
VRQRVHSAWLLGAKKEIPVEKDESGPGGVYGKSR